MNDPINPRLDEKSLKKVGSLYDEVKGDRLTKDVLQDKALRRKYAADPDGEKRAKRDRKRCPLKDDEWICKPSRDIPRNSKGEIVPYMCLTLSFFESCEIYLKYREEYADA